MGDAYTGSATEADYAVWRIELAKLEFIVADARRNLMTRSPPACSRRSSGQMQGIAKETSERQKKTGPARGQEAQYSHYEYAQTRNVDGL
jgi:hypothetical protein